MEIHNVVAKFHVNTKLNLTNIATRSLNVQFKPSKFHAATMRLHVPKCIAIIFSSGKILLMGAINESQCNLGARKVTRLLYALGNDVELKDFKIVNILASSRILGHTIDLHQFVRAVKNVQVNNKPFIELPFV